MKFKVFHFVHKAAYSDESMMDIMMGRVDLSPSWARSVFARRLGGS